MKFFAWLSLAVGVLSVNVRSEEVSGSSRTEEYVFLDQVEEAVGFDTFSAVTYSSALNLARSLDEIDRWNLDPEGFVNHLLYAHQQSQRYYRDHPLRKEEVEAYLEPYRIRNESTVQTDWLSQLGQVTGPITEGAETADVAAALVLTWVSENIRMKDSGLSYPLPRKGEFAPLTVLKTKEGTEFDHVILGIGLLRSAGVAARFVWAPALRQEVGGKVWLEYKSETAGWIPWIASFSPKANHWKEAREVLGPKVTLVLTRPESPFEVTSHYTEMMEVVVMVPSEDTVTSFLVKGADSLLPIRGGGQFVKANEKRVLVGRGELVVAASFGSDSFALLAIEPAKNTSKITISAEGRGLEVVSKEFVGKE